MGLVRKLETKKNLDAFRARLFTPNSKTGTGVFIDAGTDSSIENITSNYATVGVLQLIAIGQAYLTYDINDKFYIMFAPQYTYGFDGEETRAFLMDINFGYHIDENKLVYLETSTEGEVIFNFKFKVKFKV